MRKLLAALIAAAVSAGAYADDAKKTEHPPKKAEAKADDSKEKSRNEKLISLRREMSNEQQTVLKEYQSSEGDKKQAALNKYMGIAPAYSLKMYKLAEENPKDDVGFDAAMAAFQFGQGGAMSKKAMDMILTYHIDNPKLKPLIPNLGGGGDAGMTALKTLSEKSKDKEVQGESLYYLGAARLENADYPRTGKPLSMEEQTAEFKDAKAILTRAAKEFGDVKIVRGRKMPNQTEAEFMAKQPTIAKQVEGQMFFLNNLTVGKTMPDATSENLDGQKVKISDYRGKVVVLDIWATWCGPCRAMIPHEREMTGKLKDKPFTLISLSADDKKETLTKFLDTTPMPWTHWWNGGARGGAVEAYKVRFFPTVYVLDAKGVIRHKHLRGDDLEKAVEKMLAEMGAKGE
jgi:peroxiredoxin